VGSFLFDDSNFAQFFVRLCTGAGPVLTASDRSDLDAYTPNIAGFIEYVLVRDPTLRPNIGDVRRSFDQMALAAQDFILESRQ